MALFDDTNSFTVTISVAAATLSSPTTTDITAVSATIGCTTDTAGGTLYWYVSTSAIPPSATDLKAGTGAVSFGNFVPSLGANTVSAGGLSASTGYYHHWVQDNGQDSNILSSLLFTTLPAGAFDGDGDAPLTSTFTAIGVGAFSPDFAGTGDAPLTSTLTGVGFGIFTPAAPIFGSGDALLASTLTAIGSGSILPPVFGTGDAPLTSTLTAVGLGAFSPAGAATEGIYVGDGAGGVELLAGDLVVGDGAGGDVILEVYLGDGGAGKKIWPP